MRIRWSEELNFYDHITNRTPHSEDGIAISQGFWGHHYPGYPSEKWPRRVEEVGGDRKRQMEGEVSRKLNFHNGNFFEDAGGGII